MNIPRVASRWKVSPPDSPRQDNPPATRILWKFNALPLATRLHVSVPPSNRYPRRGDPASSPRKARGEPGRGVRGSDRQSRRPLCPVESCLHPPAWNWYSQCKHPSNGKEGRSSSGLPQAPRGAVPSRRVWSCTGIPGIVAHNASWRFLGHLSAGHPMAFPGSRVESEPESARKSVGYAVAYRAGRAAKGTLTPPNDGSGSRRPLSRV